MDHPSVWAFTMMTYDDYYRFFQDASMKWVTRCHLKSHVACGKVIYKSFSEWLLRGRIIPSHFCKVWSSRMTSQMLFHVRSTFPVLVTVSTHLNSSQLIPIHLFRLKLDKKLTKVPTLGHFERQSHDVRVEKINPDFTTKKPLILGSKLPLDQSGWSKHHQAYPPVI